MTEVAAILRPVTAPELTASEYGQAVNDQFENINTNFAKLANRDFVKGESGQNLELVRIRIGAPSAEDTSTEDAELVIDAENIKSAIRTLFNITDPDDARLAPVGEHNWGEGLTGKYIHAYRIMDGATYKYAFSEPFIFRDMRWAEIDDSNIDDYASIIDTSCVVYIDTDHSPYEFESIAFKAIASAPSLYYEDGEFKWRINGAESGILARGPEGAAGTPGKTYILKAERQSGSTSSTNECKVTQVYQYSLSATSGGGEYASWIDIGGYELVAGQSAIVVIDADSRTDKSGSTTGYDYFYLSTVRSHKTEGNTDYFVTCAPENCIPLFFDGMKFNTILGEISNDSAVMGLFLPISGGSNVRPTGSREWVESLDRHVIESTTDSESNDFRKVLTIAPVKGKGEHTAEFNIANASININYPKISFANPDSHDSSEGVRFSHGINVQAIGANSHAEGWNTIAGGSYSHVEGSSTTAGEGAHAEGCATKALSLGSHAEGYDTETGGEYEKNEKKPMSFTFPGLYSHAEGNSTIAQGPCSHAEGMGTFASGNGSHAEGHSTIASMRGSHAEGYNTTASGLYSHAEGYGTEDKKTEASGIGSHAEGYTTTAKGAQSHAEGYNTTASGNQSHAEGYNTTAKGAQSHAEGYNTTANGDYSHVTGSYNTAEGTNSTLQGYYLFDHGIDVENSFIWLDTYNNNGVNYYGCGFIKIIKPYIKDPGQTPLAGDPDPRIGCYEVQGSFWKYGGSGSGWTEEVHYPSSGQQRVYYIKDGDLKSIMATWNENTTPDGKTSLTDSFVIYEYLEQGGSYQLIPVESAFVVGYKSTYVFKSPGSAGGSAPYFPYPSRIASLLADHIDSEGVSVIKGYQIAGQRNVRPREVENRDATIVGRYNRPRYDDIFEVGCGGYYAQIAGEQSIVQRNAISVKSDGKTTIPNLKSDVVAVGSETSSSIHYMINLLPETSYPQYCRSFICNDGILIGYSSTAYMYLTIDDQGKIYLGRYNKKAATPDNKEERAELTASSALQWVPVTNAE